MRRLAAVGLLAASLSFCCAASADAPMARLAVATAHPLASEAAYRMLQAGGTAVDAAIAAQMVLALVEPQSSGIGGGAFLLHWDGHRLDAWDGRETAPSAARETLFQQEDGQAIPFMEAVVGGRAVGVPGLLRMLEQAHRAHGRLPWASLFQPAIDLAEQGFALSRRLHDQLEVDEHLRADPLARRLYYAADGRALPVGHRLRNPALAEVLRRAAQSGSDAFYRGAVAADIVRRVRGHARNPGLLSEQDMAGYAARRREALCTDWLDLWRVCGFPPPSSGHIAIMQILGLLAQLPPAAPALRDGLPSADWLHGYTEAARLAFADRAQYVADPDFVPAPAGDWASLLAPAYLRERAALIGPRSMGSATAGQPGGAHARLAPQREQPEHGTSHLSVVDGEGRVLAMTATIEAPWGARLMSDGGTGLPGGFLLNNELTDFSFLPADDAGRPVANRVQPGKRPRSSMSPTLVFARGAGGPVLATGSPGGAAIIHYTAKSLIAALQWGLAPQQAAALPNFGTFNGPTLLERGRFPAATLEALRQRGHAVEQIPMNSGVQTLRRTPAGWFGGADPRREGQVRGE